MIDKPKKYCDGIDCAFCSEKEPCIYKIANRLESELRAKEQECDKLYIQLKADEEYHKEEENTLRKIIKNKEERNIELYKENNQLKVKNEKLKESLKVWKYSDVQHIFKINKYEQTLTEIKGIAEKRNYLDYNECLDDILQKISECEVEDDNA